MTTGTEQHERHLTMALGHGLDADLAHWFEIGIRMNFERVE